MGLAFGILYVTGMLIYLGYKYLKEHDVTFKEIFTDIIPDTIAEYGILYIPMLIGIICLNIMERTEGVVRVISSVISWITLIWVGGWMIYAIIATNLDEKKRREINSSYPSGWQAESIIKRHNLPEGTSINDEEVIRLWREEERKKYHV